MGKGGIITLGGRMYHLVGGEDLEDSKEWLFLSGQPEGWSTFSTGVSWESQHF